jgi:hypothetical protein
MPVRTLGRHAQPRPLPSCRRGSVLADDDGNWNATDRRAPGHNRLPGTRTSRRLPEATLVAGEVHGRQGIHGDEVGVPRAEASRVGDQLDERSGRQRAVRVASAHATDRSDQQSQGQRRTRPKAQCSVGAVYRRGRPERPDVLWHVGVCDDTIAAHRRHDEVPGLHRSRTPHRSDTTLAGRSPGSSISTSAPARRSRRHCRCPTSLRPCQLSTPGLRSCRAHGHQP